MRINSLLAAAALAASVACTGQTVSNGGGGDTIPAGSTSECAIPPLETRPANAPDQRPAFEGQTRACGLRSNVAHQVTVLARGLVHPWSVEPLPDGSFLVTERPGRLRHVAANGTLGAPIQGLPAVDGRGQGGLLDVALSPNFASDRTIFWSLTEPRQGGNGTAVARGVLSSDRTRVENVQVIFHAMPTYDNTMHFGSRVVPGPDGMLYITMGERSDTPMRMHAQQLDNHLGKTLRIRPDGSVPPDNPFVNEQGARPEIWTLGHRNVQAATFDSRGRLWEVEMGTRGGDELNLIQRGRNYGWPRQAYGIEYNGQPIVGSATTGAGFEQPTYYWDPVIAPSGAEWYTGNAFPAWRNSLFIGGLAGMRLVRLVIDDNNRVTGEEHLLVDRQRRIRDVKQGRDGNLYVVTDHENGELWRISPQ